MKIELIEAKLDMIPVVQNMARFYAYDMSKYCGQYSPYSWEFPENGLYEAEDFSYYWEPNHYPFVIRIENELGGFALISKKGSSIDTDWNMGEFFIVGRFQNKGIGCLVAKQLFDRFPGKWEVSQMLDNIPAIQFWKKVICDYTQGHFSEGRKTILEPEPHENIVLKFNNTPKR
jgi:predicted acetyltransferase